MLGGLARITGNFHAAVIQFRDAVGHADLREFVAICAEGVGFNELRAGFDVGLVNAEYGFGVGGVELVDAALGASGFIEERAHGAVGDKEAVFEAVVEVVNSHCELADRRIALRLYADTARDKEKNIVADGIAHAGRPRRIQTPHPVRRIHKTDLYLLGFQQVALLQVEPISDLSTVPKLIRIFSELEAGCRHEERVGGGHQETTNAIDEGEKCPSAAGGKPQATANAKGAFCPD